MRCIKNSGKSSRLQRLERTAMKNGFKPGVHEYRGLYVGNWVNDMKQGKGKMLYKDHTVYEGDWVANKRHGFGVLMKKVDDCFVLIYEGQWNNDRFDKGKWYDNSGIYEGNFSKAGARIKCGYGTMWWNDGAVYRGHWRNNEFDGRGKYVEAGGNFYDGQWRNGRKHGEGVYVFKDKGQCMEGVWNDGIPKVSIITHTDEQRQATDEISTVRRLIPKILPSDESDLQKVYDRTKSERLNGLNNVL